jgi:hypothetical protein
MNKALLGLIVGTVLGAIDGLAAGFYPAVLAVEGKLLFIALASSCKGLVAGLITGFIARKYRNLPVGIFLGFLIAALVSLAPAIQFDPELGKTPFWEIMIPGSICGATQRYGKGADEPAKAPAK